MVESRCKRCLSPFHNIENCPNAGTGKVVENSEMKTLISGATRSSSGGKFDYEGFINPGVLFEYAKYLHKHRMQADGKLRDPDNWQRGMSRDDCMKPLARHFLDVWLMHRGYSVYREKTDTGEETHIFYRTVPIPTSWVEVTMMDALCGVLFNTMGYMLALIRGEEE